MSWTLQAEPCIVTALLHAQFTYIATYNLPIVIRAAQKCILHVSARSRVTKALHSDISPKFSGSGSGLA